MASQDGTADSGVSRPLSDRLRELVRRGSHVGETLLRVLWSYWLVVAVAAFYIAIFWDNPFDNIPFLATTVFSTVTLVFAYFAYRFSREKFRLDLLDKRLAIYEATIEFCSRATALGSLRAARPEQREAVEHAIRAAEGSFRGIGYHKARLLFGDDIRDLFSELNKSYAWLASFADNAPHAEREREKWARTYERHMNFIWDTANNLPDLFRAYMYFGDYKRD